MTKFEEMSSYVSDASRHAVCGEMASAIGVKDSVTKDKLAFETIEIALSKAREVRVEDSQVPYLCQFCQFWHLGKNIRIGLDERIFYIQTVWIWFQGRVDLNFFRVLFLCAFSNFSLLVFFY